MWSDEEIAALRADRINLAFFLRAEVGETVLRLYAGVGDFPLGPDDVETDGGVYTCVGRWAEGAPDVDHLLNGEAQAVSLGLTGVDREAVQAYLLDRSLIIGAPAAMGWCALDDRYRPIGAVRWPIRGLLSQPRIQKQRTRDGGWSRTLSVVLLNGPVGRRRAAHAYLTASDQRRRSPTDAFCDRVGQLAPGVTRRWPN